MVNEIRSPRYSQKVEVLRRKDEIVELLAVGFPYAQIRLKLGLDHIAERTFRYHAAKLKASIEPVDGRARKSVPVDNEGKEVQQTRYQVSEDPSTPVQSEQPDGYKPPPPVEHDTKRKKPLPKRRKGALTPNIDADDLNLNPVNWDKKL